MTTTLFWLRSQRDAVDVYDRFTRPRLQRFKAVAAQAGLEMQVATVDDFTIELAEDGRARLMLGDRAVESSESFFHTATMTWPAYSQDVWRYQTFSQLLTDLGFCITTPPDVNSLVTDKYLTLVQGFAHDLPILPTLRVMTRQFRRIEDLIPLDLLHYPVAVKPANWGSGFGILRATDRATLDAALQLAGAAELSMVVQPWIEGLSDYRIYCFNGRPEAAMVRTGQPGALVANISHGAATARTAVPPWAVEPARLIAEAVESPYLCVDFVATEAEFWLSEIEVDGGILPTSPFRDLLSRRFQSYVQHFEDFRAKTAPSGV